MKGVMATVEIFVFTAEALAASGPYVDPSSTPGAPPRRLSLVIGTPERAPAGDRWQCRVALADTSTAQRP